MVDVVEFLEGADPMRVLSTTPQLTWKSADALRCLADERTTQPIKRWCADLQGATARKEGKGNCSIALKTLLVWRTAMCEELRPCTTAPPRRAEDAMLRGAGRLHDAVVDAACDAETATHRRRLIAERWSRDPAALLADLQQLRGGALLNDVVILPQPGASASASASEDEDEEEDEDEDEAPLVPKKK